jgi:hypothetical protein
MRRRVGGATGAVVDGCLAESASLAWTQLIAALP